MDIIEKEQVLTNNNNKDGSNQVDLVATKKIYGDIYQKIELKKPNSKIFNSSNHRNNIRAFSTDFINAISQSLHYYVIPKELDNNSIYNAMDKNKNQNNQKKFKKKQKLRSKHH